MTNTAPSSYANLTQNELNKIDAILSIVEQYIPNVYNDGYSNASIGVGLNLRNQDSLLAALASMTYTVTISSGNTTSAVTQTLNVFQAALQTPGIENSISDVLAQFNEVLQENSLVTVVSNGHRIPDPVSRANLITGLNDCLRQYFFNYINALQLAQGLSPAESSSLATTETSNLVFNYNDAGGIPSAILAQNYIINGGNISSDGSSISIGNSKIENVSSIAGKSAQLYKLLISQGADPSKLPPPNSDQWAALVTVAYQSFTPLIDNQTLIKALNTGNSAQVWFSLRYDADLNPIYRTYLESQAYSITGSTPITDASSQQVVNAYQTLTENRSTIYGFEQVNGTDPDGAGLTPETPLKSIKTANSLLSANLLPGLTLPSTLTVAENTSLPINNPIETLAQTFDPLAVKIIDSVSSSYAAALPSLIDIDEGGRLVSIDNPVGVDGGNSLDLKSTNIYVAASQNDINDGFQSTEDPLYKEIVPEDLNSTNLIIGNVSGDTLQGGNYSDLLIAAIGDETIRAGSGDETLVAGTSNFSNFLTPGANSVTTSNDRLVEGAGHDVFVITTSTGISETQTIDANYVGDGEVEVLSGGTVIELGGDQNHPIQIVAGAANTWFDASTSTNYQITNLINGVGTLRITGGSVGADTVIIDNFNLTKALYANSSSTGFLGFFLSPELVSKDAPTLQEGALQTFTMTLAAPCEVTQQLTISLAGSNPADFAVNTGTNLIAFDQNGIATVDVPAGQDSVTLALVNTGDVQQDTTLQITGTIGDPNSPLATSNTLSIDYTPGTPDPFVDPQTSTSIDPTEVKDPNTDTFLYNQYQGDGSNDLIVTNSGPNVVALGNGNDIVNDVSGGDVIGAEGVIDGGAGSPFQDYSGGNGNNVITLNNNSDVVLVGNGNNRIYGNTEDTNLSDNINAARSNDATQAQGALIGVGEGNNTIVGGDGDNLILTGAGDNLIVTGPGDDTLIAGVQTDDALSTWTTTDTDTSAGLLVNISGVDLYSDNYVSSDNYEGVTDHVSGAPVGVGNDSIFAGSGSDIIFLSNGDNYVDLGTGDSSVYGGMGNNSIFGGSGNIEFYGGGGNDYVEAESGNDYLIGRGGNNTIIGGSGNDTIHAGGDGVNYATEESGDNYVEGGTGNSLIYGSDGNDTLIAGSGNTTIFGGDGNEYIEGGSGNDSLKAVGGNDTIDAGGAGNDTIFATAGNVTITGGLGTDLIEGGSGTNLIYSGDGGTTDAPTTVIGGSGDNTIYGGSGVNQIFADNGVDDNAGSATIYGGTGTELIDGGAGVDVIYAGDGGTVDQPVSVVADTGLTTIYGGAGDDILYDTLGGSDVLMGGSGDDTIIGTGSDTLEAGSGNDFLQFETGNGLYKFDSGFGDDTIDGQSSSDTLEFGTQFSPDQLTLSAGLFSNGSNALVIDTGEGTIAVEGGLTGGLGNTIFDDPQTLSLSQLVQQASDVSTTVGGQFSDGQIGFLTFDTEDNDTLSSTGYRDTIAAFGNNDVLESGSTDESTSGQISASIIEAFGDGSLVYGGEGSDSLQALGANDTLIGGTGADSFTVTDGSDVVQEAYAGTGSILYSTVDYTLPTNVETLIFEGNSDLTATGNSDATNVIQANTGDDTLIAGQAVATLVGGSGNDTFVVNNTNDVVQGASAASTNVIDSSVSYVLPTNVNTLALTGTSNLVATANAGNDLISANLGNDTLVAGTGNDTLQGNYGSTTFDFTQPFGADQIVGTLGTDVLEFGSAIPQFALAVSAIEGSDGLPALVINTGEGTITIDGGLSSSLKTVEFDGGATYTLQQFLAAESFSETIPGSDGNLIVDARPGQAITGGSGKDTIAAFGNDDTLTAGSTDTQIDAGGDSTLLDGGVGNDTLNAFGLNDTLVGGSGNDTFIVDSTTAVVQDASSTSINVLRSSASYVLPTDVDTLTLEGIANLSGTGNTDAANRLTGNAGNDTLTAGTGRDTLVAGTGLATLVGGAGNDTFVVNDTGDIVQDASTTSQNAIESSVSFVLPVHVDTLTLTGSGDLVATGNSDSSNLITANSGDDTLIAGVAIATLVGGAGNDTFVVNNAGDVVEDSSTTGDNTIESSVSYVLPTDVDTLTLTGTADLAAAGNSDTANLLTGNAGNDTLTAGSGSDTLVAGSGLATLVGGSGSDTFVINNVNDVVQDASTTASNAIESSVSYVLPTDVDTLTLTGSGDLTAAGNADASNLITGNAGNDTLTAGSGSDTLVAGSGLATLVGGSGNDTFVVDDVSDVVQDSSTTASNVIESSVDFVLPTNVDTLTLTGTDDLVGTGNSDTANVITANDGDDTLVAGTAIATLIGGVGNDTFVVNNAADVVQDGSATTDNAIVSSVSYVLPTNVDTLVLTGSANLSATGNNDATNLLVGADGQDTLTAGSGTDTLEAGSGLATLVGGAGDDTFVVNNTADVVQDSATTGNSTVESSVSYVLPSNVDTLAITGTGLTATGNSDASNTIEDSGSGDSTLVAGSGSHQLLEGAAGDTYVVNSETNAVIEQTSGSGIVQFGGPIYFFSLTPTVSLDTNGHPELQLGIANGDQIAIDGGLDGAISSFNFTNSNFQLTVGQLFQYTGVSDQTIAGANGNLILSNDYGANLVGGTGQDSIYGFGYQQTITGGAAGQVLADLIGSNTLNDGVGGDTLEGSSETTYDVSGLASDEIKQLSGAGILDFAAGITASDLSISAQLNDTGGTDLIIQTANGSSITVDNGFEGAISSFHFADGSQLTLSDLLLASGFSDSTLTGANGNYIINVDDNTSVVGGSGDDTILALGSDDTVIAGSGDQILRDLGTDNVLEGGAGADTLIGGAGPVSLVSGTGINTLVAGTGSDEELDINNSADVIQVGLNNEVLESDTIVSSVNYTATTPISTVELTGNANLTADSGNESVDIIGNAGNDTLTASGYSGCGLIAGSGIDTLVSNNDNTQFFVNNSSDVIVQNVISYGTVTSSASYILPANLTQLTLTGSSNLMATGNNLNDTITGNSGLDTLIAGSGNDLLIGSVGDTYVFNGDFGADIVSQPTGSELIDFTSLSGPAGLTVSEDPLYGQSGPSEGLVFRDGSGSVEVVAALSGSDIEFQFSGGPTESLEQVLSEIPLSDQTIAGSAGNLIFNGDAGGTVQGGSGQDTIIANGAGDTVSAGSGNNDIYGAGNLELLVGGPGEDSLHGGGVSDTLIAGTGTNTLYGGTGTDNYVLTEGGVAEIYPSNTVGAEVLYLPAGASLADYTSYRSGENLIVQSLSGDTTAVLNGYFTEAATKTWYIASDNDPTEFLSDWIESTSNTASGYEAEISQLRQADGALSLASLNSLGTSGYSLGSLPDTNPDYYHPVTYNYTFTGVSSINVEAQAGITDLVPSEMGSAQTVTTTTSHQVQVPIYGTRTQAGNSFIASGYIEELNPGTSGNANQTKLESYFLSPPASAPPGAIGVSAPYGDTLTPTGPETYEGNGIYATNFIVSGASISHQVITGYQTQTVTETQQSTNVTRGLVYQNVVGDGGNDTITAASTFVGTVQTGNGNVDVNLGSSSEPDWNDDPNINPALSGRYYPEIYDPSDPFYQIRAGAFVQAGSGNDTIVGSNGSDTIAAGTGFDYIDGGRGGDTYYAPLVGDSTTVINDTGNPAFVNGYEYGGYAPLDTLVLPDNITINDLKYRIFQDPDNPYLNVLQLSYGTANVLVDYLDNPNLGEQASVGIDRFQFSDGTVLTRNQLISQIALQANDFDPVVMAGAVAVGLGQSIAASQLFSATDNIDNPITYYKISNDAQDGGYFVLSGTAQAANTSFMVSADQLSQLTYVGGANVGTDNITVSAFDGAIWSAATTLSVLSTSDIQDTFFATGPDQSVSGGVSGAETLTGGYSGDTLVGGGGAAPITFVVGDPSVTIEDAPNGGQDSILSSVSYNLPYLVDNLTLIGSADATVNGNADNDSIVGNSGDDTLIAGSGNDTLVAGSGNDNLISGSGLDTLIGGTGADVFDIENTGDVLDLAPNSQNDTINAGVNYTLSDAVNNLVLVGSNNLVGTGNNNNDLLIGNDGDSTLVAGSGNDTLASGSGAGVVTMVGGSGNDLFVVKNVGDTIEEPSVNAGAAVDSYVNYTLPDNVDQLTLLGEDNLTATGNSDNDYITGNDGNDTLIAGSGNDTLVSGANATTLVGGTGTDLFVVNNSSDVVQLAEGANGANDQINSSVSYTLDDSINNLIATGTADVTDIGNNNNDLLIGNDGDDTLIAGSGNDTLASGSGVGAVTMMGGSGDDTFVIKNPGDTIVEPEANAGAIAVSYIDFVLPENVNQLVLVGSANLTATANSGNDQLIGTGSSDAFIGMGGNDTVYGGSGNSFIETGTGNDFIQSDALNNVISENVGDGQDTVQGANNAANTLSLGGGVDYSQIGLSRVGDDLIVNMGGSDSITLQGWYYESQLQNVATLQIVEQASSTYNASSSNNLDAHLIDTFDFSTLVDQFNQAMQANPDLGVWNIANAAPSALVSVSDTAALGGEAAYSYGMTGVATYDENTLLGDSNFGINAQTFTANGGNTESDKLLTVDAAQASSGTHSQAASQAPMQVTSKPLLVTTQPVTGNQTDGSNDATVSVSGEPLMITTVPATDATADVTQPVNGPRPMQVTSKPLLVSTQPVTVTATDDFDGSTVGVSSKPLLVTTVAATDDTTDATQSVNDPGLIQVTSKPLLMTTEPVTVSATDDTDDNTVTVSNKPLVVTSVAATVATASADRIIDSDSDATENDLAQRDVLSSVSGPRARLNTRLASVGGIGYERDLKADITEELDPDAIPVKSPVMTNNAASSPASSVSVLESTAYANASTAVVISRQNSLDALTGIQSLVTSALNQVTLAEMESAQSLTPPTTSSTSASSSASTATTTAATTTVTEKSDLTTSAAASMLNAAAWGQVSTYLNQPPSQAPALQSDLDSVESTGLPAHNVLYGLSSPLHKLPLASTNQQLTRRAS